MVKDTVNEDSDIAIDIANNTSGIKISTVSDPVEPDTKIKGSNIIKGLKCDCISTVKDHIKVR